MEKERKSDSEIIQSAGHYATILGIFSFAIIGAASSWVTEANIDKTLTLGALCGGLPGPMIGKVMGEFIAKKVLKAVDETRQPQEDHEEY